MAGVDSESCCRCLPAMGDLLEVIAGTNSGGSSFAGDAREIEAGSVGTN